MARKGGAKRAGRAIADPVRDLCNTVVARAEHVLCKRHPPVQQVAHWGGANDPVEASKKSRAGQPRLIGQFGHSPGVFWCGVYCAQGRTDPGIGYLLEAMPWLWLPDHVVRGRWRMSLPGKLPLHAHKPVHLNLVVLRSERRSVAAG